MSAIKKKRFYTTTVGNTIRFVEFSNVDDVVQDSFIERCNHSDAIKDIIGLGYEHSKSGALFLTELSERVLDWEYKIALEQELKTISHNKLPNSSACDECKERSLEYMKNTVPLSYVIFGAVSLIGTVVFSLLLILSITRDLFLMSPWINIALCVASFGMTMTVIAAVIERRHFFNGSKKQATKKQS